MVISLSRKDIEEAIKCFIDKKGIKIISEPKIRLGRETAQVSIDSEDLDDEEESCEKDAPGVEVKEPNNVSVPDFGSTFGQD